MLAEIFFGLCCGWVGFIAGLLTFPLLARVILNMVKKRIK